MFARRAFIAVLAACLFASGIPAQVRYEQTRTAMGSDFTIVAYGKDEAQLEPAVNAALDEITRLDRELSDYLETSDISLLNQEASDHPVQVGPELFRLLQTCFQYSKDSGGAFDITVGPLLRVWGFYKGTGRLPKKEEIADALRSVGWEKVRLNEHDRTVFFTAPGMKLDLGGVGKGYALDRAAAILRDAGIQSALLLASTSTIVAIGAPPGEEGWPVKIRDPKVKDVSVAEVLLKNNSLSTSGNYEKFFKAEGTIYSHIFDPRTGWPSQGRLESAVIAPTGAASDALTKPFFILDDAWAKSYLSKHKELRAMICTEAGCKWLAP